MVMGEFQEMKLGNELQRLRGLRSIRPSVDTPRVDPPHVRPKRGRSAPS